jgi:hypothetical protein
MENGRSGPDARVRPVDECAPFARAGGWEAPRKRDRCHAIQASPAKPASRDDVWTALRGRADKHVGVR